eukprot:GHVS01065099.1.p1 GENE.GHVS01065099.1~~GHVS01065099.1.p1  ORF type:complete len:530 (+),score=96.68 GHVS01065099.1:257-1846(+)
MEPSVSAHYVSFLNSSSPEEDLLPGNPRDDGHDIYTGVEQGYPVCEGSVRYLPPVPGRRDGSALGSLRRVLGGRAGKTETVKVAWTMLVSLICLAGFLAVCVLLFSPPQGLFKGVEEERTEINLASAGGGGGGGSLLQQDDNNTPTTWMSPVGLVADDELRLASNRLSSSSANNSSSAKNKRRGDVSLWGASKRVDAVNGLRPPLIWMWEENDFINEFDVFVETFAKSYSKAAAEFRYRYGIFKKNVYFIHSHNTQDKSYKVRMNKFGDLTFDEFKASYLGLRARQPRRDSLGLDLTLLEVTEDNVPKSIDWKEKGCVSEVKDQKQCGSCWAFSTTGALEGANCAQGGKLLDLSEQQLVDCGKPEGNMGCDGGQMDEGFQYVIDNKGICSESDYPYSAVTGKCVASKCTNVLHIQGFKDVPVNNETAMKAALSRYGPLAVGIEADEPGFQFYSHGVFGGKCGNSLDHGVLLIGYGTDQKTGVDFWTIKNSWGSDWGDGGFIQLAQHKKDGGECGVTETPSFPVIGSPME